MAKPKTSFKLSDKSTFLEICVVEPERLIFCLIFTLVAYFTHFNQGKNSPKKVIATVNSSLLRIAATLERCLTIGTLQASFMITFL